MVQALTILVMAVAVASAQSAHAASDAPPTVADPIRGLDLWRGAKVGMSVAEVRYHFPGASPPFKPNVLTGGQIDRLQLSHQTLVEHPSIAHFYFEGPQLVSVELTATDFKPGERLRNLEEARNIAANYTSHYGAGYDCGSRSLGDINVYECKWLRGRLSIQLWYMDVAGQAPLFYVAYKQADDPSYNL